MTAQGTEVNVGLTKMCGQIYLGLGQAGLHLEKNVKETNETKKKPKKAITFRAPKTLYNGCDVPVVNKSFTTGMASLSVHEANSI